MGNWVDISGQTFGRLTAVSYISGSRRKRGSWSCRCACGRKTLVGLSELRNGDSRSCGCLKLELTVARSTKHSHSSKKTRAYRAWKLMKSRCRNKNLKCYERYGGRGISVCPRWDGSFVHFFADMGHPPSESHSLDRIDINGDYEPGNCRWATAIQQARNTRTSAMYTMDGRTQCRAAWAEEFGIGAACLKGRLLRGWELRRALETPVAQIGRWAARRAA